jgi:hypothetical protein
MFVNADSLMSSPSSLLISQENQIVISSILLIVQIIIFVVLSRSDNDTFDSSQNLLRSIDDVQYDTSSKVISQSGQAGDKGVDGIAGEDGANGTNVDITPVFQTFVPTMIPSTMSVTMTFSKIDRLVTVQIQTTSFTPPAASIYSMNGFFPATFSPLFDVNFPVVAFDGDSSTICSISAVGTFIYVNSNSDALSNLNQTFTYYSAT